MGQKQCQESMVRWPHRWHREEGQGQVHRSGFHRSGRRSRRLPSKGVEIPALGNLKSGTHFPPRPHPLCPLTLGVLVFSKWLSIQPAASLSGKSQVCMLLKIEEHHSVLFFFFSPTSQRLGMEKEGREGRGESWEEGRNKEHGYTFHPSRPEITKWSLGPLQSTWTWNWAQDRLVSAISHRLKNKTHTSRSYHDWMLLCHRTQWLIVKTALSCALFSGPLPAKENLSR